MRKECEKRWLQKLQLTCSTRNSLSALIFSVRSVSCSILSSVWMRTNSSTLRRLKTAEYWAGIYLRIMRLILWHWGGGVDIEAVLCRDKLGLRAVSSKATRRIGSFIALLWHCRRQRGATRCARYRSLLLSNRCSSFPCPYRTTYIVNVVIASGQSCRRLSSLLFGTRRLVCVNGVSGLADDHFPTHVCRRLLD